MPSTRTPVSSLPTPSAPTRPTLGASPLVPVTQRIGIGSLLALVGGLVGSDTLLGAEATPPPSPPVPTPFALTLSPVESPIDPQSQLIVDLLGRIHDIERREVERVQEVDRASGELVRQMQRRIAELEHKVQSLEGGRVLPEIAVTPEDGPTTAELDQKLRVLERKGEIAAEEAAARQQESPRFSAGAAGFVFRSADTNFVLRLRGLAQVDTRTFFADNPLADGNDGFFLRRARLGLDGTFYRDFDYRFQTEFAGPNAVQLLDADVAYRYRPELRLRVGKFKSPVGYEQLLSVNHLLFNERSLVSNLVPIRNTGAQLEGDVLGGRFGYAAGVYSPAGDLRNGGFFDHGDHLEFGGRLLALPFKSTGRSWLQGLGVGVGGTYTQVSSNALALPNTVGGTRPGYLTTAGQQFFAYNSPAGTVVGDGSHWRLSPHAFYTKGPFGVLGEYLVAEQGVLNATTLRQASLKHSAWQVAAQWVLSGEDATFDHLVPLRPFRPSDGGWGAWQLVGRFSGIDLDPDTFPNFANPQTAARGALSWSVGINWWLNRNLRVLTSYTQTRFDGGGAVNPVDPTTTVPPATVTAQDEMALLTRLQLAF